MLLINFKFDLGIIIENNDKYSKSIINPTDNELFGEAILKYPLGWTLDPYVSAAFRTQVTESFYLQKDMLSRKAKFWDPVTSMQAFGFSFYSKSGRDKIGLRSGFSMKQIRAYFHTALTDDRKTKEITEKYKAETGIEFISDCFFELDSSTSYAGKLEMFSAFETPDLWSIRFENQFQIKFSKLFGIILKINLFYDDKQVPKIQYNQLLSAGLIAEL